MSKELVEKLQASIATAKNNEYTKIAIPVAEVEEIVAALDQKEAAQDPGAPDLAEGQPTKEATAPEAATAEAAEEAPLTPETILKDLLHRKCKATKGTKHFGKNLPKIAIELEDVANAFNGINGVNENYLNQHGFLTAIYKNAAQRTQTDITKYSNGLSIKFV